MKHTRSARLFSDARACIPGGVNSPVRAFTAVRGTPPFMEKAKGAHLWDVDGNKYIDYIGSWGPMIAGHAHPRVIAAICAAARNGTSFGAPTALEVSLARTITSWYPSMDMVRMVSSGTEAVMSAIRLARAFTGRPRIIKFDGCYHGHADHLLVRAGSGLATLGIPDTRGVPEDFARNTLVGRYNDLASVRALVKTNPRAVAAVIVEPVAGNMGLVPPDPGFLEGLRDITAKNGSLLIFDEVISGFRVGRGGAQEHYGIRPDITCLGKIIGGGMPVGAYGGRREIMALIAPLGPVYQAGTLSGNPVAMAAGAATLSLLTARAYRAVDALTAELAEGIRDGADTYGIPVTINRMGSLFTVFFGAHAVRDYDTAKQCDTRRFAAFFHRLLDAGIYPPPSQFEAWFVSFAHTHRDIAKTIAACRRAFSVL